MNITDLIRQRFEKVNSEYLNVSGGKVNAEPSKLRIEVPLRSGVGSYKFDIKKSDIINEREVSLDRNDVFIPNFLGLFVALQPQNNPEKGVLFSYIPVKPATGESIHAVGFTDDSLETLYNGKLIWNIDNGVLFSSFPTERFKKVPQTQGAFVLDTQDTAVNEQIQSEWDVAKQSELMIPKITIAGTRDHKIMVNFDASGLNFNCTSGYNPVLVLYLDGFLVKNGCEYFDAKNPNAKAIGQW